MRVTTASSGFADILARESARLQNSLGTWQRKSNSTCTSYTPKTPAQVRGHLCEIRRSACKTGEDKIAFLCGSRIVTSRVTALAGPNFACRSERFLRHPVELPYLAPVCGEAP